MTRLDLRAWAATLRGSITLPGDVAYDSARRVWNLDIDRHPAAIVHCAVEGDVARAVELARTRDLLVAVRGGGHSQAGFSTCDGGIIIDLGNMNQVGVDRTARVAHAGAGARVGALLEATVPLGLAVPTGDCPEVGIAGLTLGGGENALMASRGAVCDALVSARVVTADARIVTASAYENPDLFWAIRGGGGNFGIVTAFDFALEPLDRVLLGRMMFPVARTREVMRRYRDVMSDPPDALQTSAGIMSTGQEPALFINFCYCGNREDGNRLLREGRNNLQPDSDTIEWKPYSADLSLAAVASAGTGAFVPALTDDAIDALAESFAAAPPWCTAVLNDFHGAVTRVAVDAMAFPLRQRGYDLFVHAIWKTPEDRAAALAWLTALSTSIRPFAHGIYVNNLGIDHDARTREAYGPNYERLVAIKAKYDPANVFRLNPNIPPREKNTRR